MLLKANHQKTTKYTVRV